MSCLDGCAVGDLWCYLVMTKAGTLGQFTGGTKHSLKFTCMDVCTELQTRQSYFHERRTDVATFNLLYIISPTWYNHKNLCKGFWLTDQSEASWALGRVWRPTQFELQQCVTNYIERFIWYSVMTWTVIFFVCFCGPCTLYFV